jgi:hypothetical protein
MTGHLERAIPRGRGGFDVDELVEKVLVSALSDVERRSLRAAFYGGKRVHRLADYERRAAELKAKGKAKGKKS